MDTTIVQPLRIDLDNNIESANGGELIPVELEEDEDEDSPFIDSILGTGAQSRIMTSINDWITDKAKTNPGCVERFVCETYRTGETMSGIPYVLMQFTKYVCIHIKS